MALNDSFKTSGWTSSSGDVASLLFSWTAKQSIDGNSSTISWTLKGHRTKATGYVEAGGFKVVIDGDQEYSVSTNNRIHMYNGTEIASGTKTIKHKGDGTRSFTVYVEGGIYYYAVNCTGTKTFTLDTIPRASSISCSTASIESNPTITIASASPKFTHTITYAFGTILGTIAEKTSDTIITNWTIPTFFYDEIPNQKDSGGIGTLFCTTYNGDKQVGDVQECDFPVTTDKAKCTPDVSGIVFDANDRTIELTGNPNVLINGWSAAHCEMSYDIKNKATVGKLRINNIDVTSTNGTILWSGVPTGDFEFYVEDSRGYYNSFPVKKTFIPYIPLTANITAKRTDPTSGNATITIEGNCYKGHFGLESNHLKITYVQGTGKPEEVIPEITDDNKYKVTIPLTDLWYEDSFDYDIIVQDALTTLAKTATIGKGIPVFDWGEDDFNFNVPVTIKGVNILEKLAELEELVAAKG